VSADIFMACPAFGIGVGARGATLGSSAAPKGSRAGWEAAGVARTGRCRVQATLTAAEVSTEWGSRAPCCCVRVVADYTLF